MSEVPIPRAPKPKATSNKPVSSEASDVEYIPPKEPKVVKKEV